ncbi:fumarylacetoacetate hydrolase family protein [Halapricum desulfuricans]|uniref:2-keto-4-pentenoate hydratase/2-oxohepta-3-ene-1,7-dioic acid hydratase (Catechol pathway) n=1 Tax=Halapricum desulfuricans TaxID=2841257 RepID=A0A897NA62_9EURY|nr:fumarylacetoacetate hydrolase family protein [Halapricum desulfuricans]QSG08225.1 2-keto-4-pentenoate hydratase/2-oxohepta-3-ene-1,7-dioic acid hydratase (catechol pathway) [Halapricum desulfuricans]
MHDIRFRDPAGTVRNGLLHDDHVHFGDDAHDLEAVDVLAPAEPTKIVCVGRNYARHAEERGEDVPDRPLLFLKPPNAVASHGSTITLPAGKEQIEHEAELAVVIDEQCKDVDPEDADDVIRGYTCFNDVSNRDDQSREQNWVRGKAFDNAAPMGPVLAEEIPDDAAVELRVNGETRQSSSIEHFIFSIPELIAEITTYMTLEPGDVIATGTPEGVGPLTDGDHVEIEIEGIGTLEHDVRQDA